ncbi:hypothetical protein [Agromyces archimandritae]|uniref:Histidinol dehydrogenase n=1 Tax=Agromyces archimandritae TaxID=2781962 RepID=A0A975FLF0_9MICO|nr:hypothetical protein [Agromyces archimandritae]QTX04255.1 hypothetical protein G127AT_13350 [Agromyces archimandritae]
MTAVDEAARSTGSRIGGAVLAFVVGVVAGLILTVGHHHVWRIGGAELPWGLVLALAGVACLVAGLRLLAADRWPAIAAAIGIVGTVAVLTLPGPGGSVLVPGGIPGIVWAIGPALVSVVVLAWPRLPERGRRHA